MIEVKEEMRSRVLTRRQIRILLDSLGHAPFATGLDEQGNGRLITEGEQFIKRVKI